MNKRNVFALLIAALVLVSFNSCITDLFGITGTGPIVTQSRTATDFQSVTLNSAANVTIVKGDSFKVEISDYQNLVQYLSAKVVDHNLIIAVDPIYTVLVNSQAKVNITLPDSLTAVTLNGSGEINVNSAFKNLKTAIILGSGNIKVNANLNVPVFNASVVGSGNVTAKGNAGAVSALITGSGNLLLSGLTANTADCTISGSGNISLAVVSKLKATISGSGNVLYTGTPTVDVSVTGSGKVIHN